MRNILLVSKDKILFLLLFLFTLVDSMQSIYIFAQNSSFPTLVSITSIFVDVLLLTMCLTERYTISNMLIILFIGIILLTGYINSKMSVYFSGFIFLIAFRNVDIEKILKVIRYAIFCTIFLSLLLFLLGISNAGLARRGFSGFGFTHPNVAGRMIMLYVLLWVAEHHNYRLAKINVILAVSGMIIFILTGSRTVLLTMITLILFLPIFRKRFSQDKKGGVVKITEYTHPFFLCLTFVSAKFLYNVNAFKTLDTLTTNRIFLNSFALNRFGLNLFGRSTDLKTYGNIYNDLRNVYWTTGATVDSAYMTSILRMGIVPTILWTVGYVLAMRRVAKIENYVFFTIAIALCLESFMETGMLSIYANFAYFFLTAKLDAEESTGKEK